MRIIHYQDRRARVGRNVAGADELLVATEFGVSNPFAVEDMNEPPWTAPVLHVGPAGFAHGRQVEMVCALEEFALLRSQTVRLVGTS